MHFSALPLLFLAISSAALPVPSRSTHVERHVNGVDIHPQAQLEPSPSANVGTLPIASPAPAAAGDDNGIAASADSRAPADTDVSAGPSGSTYRPAGKMTNAQRMALGLGPNAPTRRSSAPKNRRSQVPMTPVAQNTDNVVIRIITTEGEDLGMISDNGDDSLSTFTPGGTPMRFSIPESSNGPFELGPSDQDDGLFGKVRKLIGAIPHRPDVAGGVLSPGSPNFANLGQGSCDPSGLLGLNLPPLPLADSAGGVFSGLPKLLAAGGLLGGGGGSDNSGGGLGGLLNIAGPLNLLGGGGGGNSNDGGDASSPPSGPASNLPILQDVPSSGGGGGGLLGIQGLLPGSGPDSDEMDEEDDSMPFLGAPKLLASRPTGPSRIPTQSAQEAGEPMLQSAQSAIWKCDALGNMGAIWQNPSGERVPARFFTGGPCAHTICLAADVDMLKNIHGADVKEINLVAGVL